MRDWDGHIKQEKYWLSGAGYNEEIRHINKKRKREWGHFALVPVNTDERYFVVKSDGMCFVIKLSVFNKMNKTQRDKLYAIGGAKP